ncbi:MAG TPA: hypothetical protein VGJ20_32390 [Xanthobacteraceae bacterium]|jgi:hypothetical protein
MSRSGAISALIIIVGLLAPAARAEDAARPPVGGVNSLPGAMIFYQARGQDGACGPNCAAWTAAEGVVEWDTYKRLFAFLERFGERKVPLVLNVWGQGDLGVATSLGKIIRERGLDVSVGTTVVAGCVKATEAECFALKRGGEPLDAKIDTSSVECDIVCVLILAGGVRRALPPSTLVLIGPTRIFDRLAPTVSAERQQGLRTRYGDQYRLYLAQMGVNAQLVDIIERNAQSGRTTPVPRGDWARLGLITPPAP